MKILVIGLYGSRNLGDAVLCDCTVHVLREAYPDADMVVEDLLGRKEPDPYGIKDFSLEVQKKDRRRNALRAAVSAWTSVDKVYDYERKVLDRNLARMRAGHVTDADAVVFAGGQILADSLALETAWFAAPYLRKGVPVCFNACGTGQQVSRRIRGILSSVLGHEAVRYIAVRDHAEEVRKMYRLKERDVEDVFDFGLLASQVYGVERSRDSGSPVGLGFMYPVSQDALAVKAFWIRLIQFLEDRGIPWRAFCNGSGRDMGFAEFVLRDMPDVLDRHQGDLADIPRTQEELVRQIAGFRGILSFRLHSHILAASCGVPSVAFVWDDKLCSFFGKMGCPERAVSLPAGPEEVWDQFLAAEENGWNQDILRDGIRRSSEMLTSADIFSTVC